MNLIILGRDEIDANGIVQLADRRAKHISRVLKARPGTKLKVGILNGPTGDGVVERMDNERVFLRCAFADTAPERPRVDMVLAMPRPKVLARLWSRLAALGVGKIVILRTRKVERSYLESHVLEERFYNQRLMEGLEIAKRTRLPEVKLAKFFKPFVEDELDTLFPASRRLVADTSGPLFKAEMISAQTSSNRNPSDPILFAIGPEGGWEPYELNMLETYNFQPYRIGCNTLPSDAACIGTLSILQHTLSISSRKQV